MRPRALLIGILAVAAFGGLFAVGEATRDERPARVGRAATLLGPPDRAERPAPLGPADPLPAMRLIKRKPAARAGRPLKRPAKRPAKRRPSAPRRGRRSPPPPSGIRRPAPRPRSAPAPPPSRGGGSGQPAGDGVTFDDSE